MLQTILLIALLNIVYLVGFFGLSIWLNVAETEYFLGFNRPLFRFRIRQVTSISASIFPSFHPSIRWQMGRSA